MTEAKYQRLAGEYAKLRAQALVLKKAVLDEQGETVKLREQQRHRETALRRAEAEVDSLGFRNKQLEHRVAALQEEIATHEGRKRDKDEKKRTGHPETQVSNANGRSADLAQDALIFEELQKKIMENAQLTSLIDDRERELLLHADRISTLEKRATEQSELEKRLRRDLGVLQSRNADLEIKLVEAASLLGSEDALSVSGSDNTSLHNTHTPQNHAPNSLPHHTSEERIVQLEKEVVHWRAQYEVAKLSEDFASTSISDKEIAPNSLVIDGNYCSCSSTAAGIAVQASFAESKSAQQARESLKEPAAPPTREELLYNKFCKKYEDLLKARCQAESHLHSYIVEAEHLQNCLENATHELKSKDEQILSVNHALQMLEEDLATTRINYEEQISVMTEQVISLSEQLAACK